MTLKDEPHMHFEFTLTPSLSHGSQKIELKSILSFYDTNQSKYSSYEIIYATLADRLGSG